MTAKIYWNRERYLLDTSSLIYAAEDWNEGYMRAISWAETKEKDPVTYLAGRRHGEGVARYILDLCALERSECYVPDVVVHEVQLTEEEDLRDRALKLLSEAKVKVIETGSVEELYSLVPYHMRDSIRALIEEARSRGRRLGIGISADPHLLLLALKHGYTLVTADRRLAELATLLGIDVVYPTAGKVRLEMNRYRVVATKKF